MVSRTMLLRPCERVRRGRGRPPIRDRGRGEAEESPPREGSETGFELVANQTLSVVLIVVKMTDFDVVLGMD